jgi:hypothetical protein
MLFKETIAVYCENHTEYTDALPGQYLNLSFIIFKAVAHVITTVFKQLIIRYDHLCNPTTLAMLVATHWRKMLLLIYP